MIAATNADAKSAEKRERPRTYKEPTAILPDWGHAQFPVGVEDLQDVWMDIMSDMGPEAGADIVETALFQVPSCVARSPRPETSDGYVWSQSFQYDLPSGVKVTILIPQSGENPQRHIAAHSQGTFTPAGERELVALLRELFHMIED